MRKITPPNIIATTSNTQPNYAANTTTHIIHPTHIHEHAAMRSNDVTIIKNVQNQQTVIEQHQNQHYTQIPNQPQQYLSNSIHNNSDASQHAANQSHIYVNAPNPTNIVQRPRNPHWVSDSNQQHSNGQHNHINLRPNDHLAQQPPHMHPGSAGHVPYSPSMGPPNNYQNVDSIRQVQYQQQPHQQFHPHGVQQQRLISNPGDRTMQIAGRNKPVGTVAPNTHTTPSVQPRLIGRSKMGISILMI